MSQLKNSLEALGNAVGNLEASLQLIEESISGQQQDMFSNGTGTAVAKRLDDAIKNVENMLGESS